MRWSASAARPPGSVLGTTDEEWQQAYESVFLAALRLTRAVVAGGTASDLAIAWVLSTSVKSPVPGLAASNGLRPGLGMLVKQLADELGPDGAPGSSGWRRAGSRPSGSGISTRSRMIPGPPARLRVEQFPSAAMATPQSSAGWPTSCSPPPRRT